MAEREEDVKIVFTGVRWLLRVCVCRVAAAAAAAAEADSVG